MMRTRYFLALIFTFLSLSGSSQYYYKDILLPEQTRSIWKSYVSNKVKKVNIASTERNGEPTPGFECSQTVSPDFRSITTFTQSADVQSSVLQTFYDASGRMIKTVDTSDSYKSVSEYSYDGQGELSSIVNTSLETDNHIQATEIHHWIYAGKAAQMIKIKNGSDTTFVNFKTDDKGRIIEEDPMHGKERLPAVYYYYDDQGRLTDIVRYNEKAGRLLPDYIFEYNTQGISSMLFVPSGSNDYQKWLYEYDDRGLKTGETCYNKRKEIMAKISYAYSIQ
ncbi:MAG: hypothetical protein Q8918_07620 [Bacteroidota bacterium]|nr:hypothetical protein [Bacteroidota bacterium]MDP4249964.1 hypothetical protein [Bacteroidota bacterium]